jgi:ribose/xylose/arabinose/galactoside ABC-type transport system permease subunit
MTVSSAVSVERSPVALMRRLFLSDYLVLGLTVLLFISLAPFTPGFANAINLLGILAYLLPLFIAAVGMTAVMITGGIDLSITSIIALTSVVGARIMTTNGSSSSAALGLGAMLALGAALGAMNGLTVTVLRLPAFIVTLASMMFLGGFAIWLTQSKNIDQLPQAFLRLGKQLPFALTLAAVPGIVVHLLVRKTVFGRWLYAIGQNATTAHISGVPTRLITFSAYVLSGFCAALASVLLTGRLETASPVLGREILLDIIGATVIGGTSLFGGRGTIVGTFFGVLFLTVLDNALNLLNLSQFSITITKGCVILFAAVLDTVRQRISRQTL